LNKAIAFVKSRFFCWNPGLVLLACMAWAPIALSDASENTRGDGDVSPAVTFALPDVWPWAYENPDGTMGGSLVKVVTRLSELTGLPVESRIRPLKRALLELRSGYVNFSIVPQSPALETEAINIEQLAKINIVLVAMADTSYPLTLEAMEGKRIGYIGGTYLGEAFEQNEKVDKVPVAEVGQAVEMLSLGRVSALMTLDHAIVSVLLAKGLEPDHLRYNIQVEGQAGALYMSRNSPRPDVAEKFREAISQMEESNELNRIFFGESGRPEYENTGQPGAQ
jgi:ABC-type amino acid transport substrate-binding protein